MKQGVLLVNLGSPDSPSVCDVRQYLREFLMDGRVLDVPYLLRLAIVNFAILPSRPRELAQAYHKTRTREGSPLVVMSRKVQPELQQRLNMPVELAMRHQNPSIAQAVQNCTLRKSRNCSSFRCFRATASQASPGLVKTCWALVSIPIDSWTPPSNG
jgi:protoheme ferro-lyase